MMIKKVIFGSQNKAKISEWTELLEDVVEILNLSENAPKVEETGKTFLENALIKGKAYAKITGEYVFAEDGGFEIDHLKGRLGVNSRRIWGNEKEATDQEIVDFVIKSLEGVLPDKRTARLTFASVLVAPDGEVLFSERGELKGLVPEKATANLVSGYPYRSLLYLPELKKTYAELTQKEYNLVSHKRKIAQKLKEFLKNYD